MTEAYASKAKPYALAFVHTRIGEYQRLGHTVTVLSFRAKADYVFDGVSVLSRKKEWRRLLPEYDICVSHAPNIKNHIRFLVVNRKNISKLAFVFHGHEVMNIARELPKPYAWNKRARIKRVAHRFYDPAKQFLLARFIRHFRDKFDLKLIFVSKFMKAIFENNIFEIDDRNVAIINNPVSKHFTAGGFQKKKRNLPLRVLCLRPFDVAKYGVDLVVNLAKENQDVSFDVFGSGIVPDAFSVIPNVTFHHKFLVQADIPNLLQSYDCAVLPTRWDSQGVSACEFATFGIPLITSDIPVMREMIGHFANVSFLDNEKFSIRIDEAMIADLEVFDKPKPHNEFALEEIVEAELAFLLNIP